MTIRDFVQHKPDCRSRIHYGRLTGDPCSCGLDEALRRVETDPESRDVLKGEIARQDALIAEKQTQLDEALRRVEELEAGLREIIAGAPTPVTVAVARAALAADQSQS